MKGWWKWKKRIFFPIKMQPVLSFSSPFVLFHVHREKTKRQKVTLGIATMFNCFLRPLECPYQLSSSFEIASSSFFCYFAYSTNFLSASLAFSLHRLLHYCPLLCWPPCLKLMALYRFSYCRAGSGPYRPVYQRSLLYYLAHQSPSNHSLKYFPPYKTFPM